MLSVFRKFKLKGNRPFLRTDEEMKSIDKVEADKAFKLYKKEYGMAVYGKISRDLLQAGKVGLCNRMV